MTIQTIRLAITITTEEGVDPETIRRNIASALELQTTSQPFTDAQKEEGFVTSAIVNINDTPLDNEGPFSIHEKQDDDGYADLPSEIRETWVGAMREAEDMEDSGLFVEIRDGAGKAVYATEG